MVFNCLGCGIEKLFSRNSYNKYCSFKCQQIVQNDARIHKWKSGEDPGWTGKTRDLKPFVRRYMLKKYNYTCRCGWNDTHPKDGLPLVEVNHIDGNAENCKEENLEVLCPGCHSKTFNFRARNKNSTRVR